MSYRVAVLIPTGGATCEWRDRALAYVVDHYRRNHPAWEIHLGHHDEPWSKGAAIADALERTDARMLVLADADSFVAPEHLAAAVEAATRDGWAMPHAMVHRLSQRATERLYAGGPLDLDDLARGAYRGVKGGGIVAITRTAYDTVGGIDPRFVGWGGEDLALNWALTALVNGGARVPGDLVHLWHPHPAPDLRGSEASEALLARYTAARKDPAAMRAILAEREEISA